MWRVMCRPVAYHCETPVAELWRPQQPPSPGGPPRPQRALGRWSLQRFPRLRHVQRGGGASSGGGIGLAPITDARRSPRHWRSPAGRVLDQNRCNLSPSVPSVSSSVGSLPVLIPSHSHTHEVLGRHFQTLLLLGLKSTHITTFPDTNNPPRGQWEKKLRKISSKWQRVYLWPSEGTQWCCVDSGVFLCWLYDKLLSWPRLCQRASTTTFPSAHALSPAATRQRGLAVYLATTCIPHDGKSLWQGGACWGPIGHLDLSLLRGPWWTLFHCPQSPMRPGHSNSHWVIIIISHESIAGASKHRGIRVLQNVLWFIAFKSLIGQRRAPTMIRKPVMWKMKDLANRTEVKKGNNKIHDKCEPRLYFMFKPLSRL